MNTFIPSGKGIEHKFRVVDAKDQRLGRLASEVAVLLMGKDNPQYVPFLDLGSHVIVINAKHIKVTGDKAQSKTYYRYSGFPGGLSAQSFQAIRDKNPARIVVEAVKGMLPKTKLGRKMGRKLHVYNDGYHPHAAQNPVGYQCEMIELGTFEVFFDRLQVEYQHWINSLSEEQKSRPLGMVGSKVYTGREMLESLKKKTEIGRRFAEQFYQSQFNASKKGANGA